MAVAGDAGSAKGMEDAEEAVYGRDVGIPIERKVARDMKHAERAEKVKRCEIDERCCKDRDVTEVRFDEDADDVGDMSGVRKCCLRPN